jgi:hypothetical protein
MMGWMLGLISETYFVGFTTSILGENYFGMVAGLLVAFFVRFDFVGLISP